MVDPLRRTLTMMADPVGAVPTAAVTIVIFPLIGKVRGIVPDRTARTPGKDISCRIPCGPGRPAPPAAPVAPVAPVGPAGPATVDAAPVAPVAPVDGSTKLRTAADVVPALVTEAFEPTATEPTDTVAAVPFAPFAPATPFAPFAPATPFTPVEPAGPVGPAGPVDPAPPAPPAVTWIETRDDSEPKRSVYIEVALVKFGFPVNMRVPLRRKNGQRRFQCTPHSDPACTARHGARPRSITT